MSPATYAVAAAVVLVVLGAAYWIYRDRRKGRNSCGCSCSGCSGCGPSVEDPEAGGQPPEDK